MLTLHKCKPEVKQLRGQTIKFDEQQRIIWGDFGSRALEGCNVKTTDDISDQSRSGSDSEADESATKSKKRKRSAGRDPKKAMKKKKKSGQEHLADAVLAVAESLKPVNAGVLDKAINLLDGEYSKPKYQIPHEAIDAALEICIENTVRAQVFVSRKHEGRLTWLKSLTSVSQQATTKTPQETPRETPEIIRDSSGSEDVTAMEDSDRADAVDDDPFYE
jgi:hypothetical protein